MRPKAYSYIRFSTDRQKLGSSLSRQTESAQRYCDLNNLELDVTLNLQDLGVSAYRGKNFLEGALKAFLDAVGSHQVPKGSFLLIESLDRLSRARISVAYRLFQDILSSGVNIVTLSDNHVYKPDAADNLIEIIISIMLMSRSHEESAIKGTRVADAWNRKKEAAQEGVKLSKTCPGWLKLSDDRASFEQLNDRVQAVRDIYRMRLDGVGIQTITTRLNSKGVRSFKGNGWGTTTVKRILTNPYVIGVYQPHRRVYSETTHTYSRVPDGEPINDYYPAIIDTSTFYKVQETFRNNTITKGRRGEFPNLFRGLLKCGKCQGSIRFGSKGKKNRHLVICHSSYFKKGCDAKGKAYHLIEPTLIKVLSILDYGRILKPDDDLDTSIYELKQSITDLDVRLSNLGDAIASSGGSLTLIEKLGSFENKKLDKEQELDRFMQLKATSRSYMAFLDSYKTLVSSELDSPDKRSKYNLLIHQAVDAIYLDNEKSTFKVVFKNKVNDTFHYNLAHFEDKDVLVRGKLLKLESDEIAEYNKLKIKPSFELSTPENDLFHGTGKLPKRLEEVPLFIIDEEFKKLGLDYHDIKNKATIDPETLKMLEELAFIR